ncbi:putative response regulator, cheY [Deinococcus aerius]|uniref:Putative response regulator, cheY n=1 Tax=Deinococcus aerius TaxID=200253 RepID=A0A2I9DUG1_9DEIO|nr:response regulator [Deinococcus aerius]GBF06367.1 putative response regulator, cheY [Deinococcus aerius]
MPQTTRDPASLPRMRRAPLDVLLVEDNPADVLYTHVMFEEVDPDLHLHVVGNGEEALAFLRREGVYGCAPRPALVLLDLNLPRMDGLEVLAHVRADEALRELFVVALISSPAEVEMWAARQTGASDFLPKPVDPAAVRRLLTGGEPSWLEEQPGERLGAVG